MGYKVRAPIRNAEKGKIVSDVFDKKHGPDLYTTILIDNMAEPGALKEAMEGCLGVIHVMSDTSMSPDPNKIIPTSLEFVRNVLRSAAATPSVRRVVHTSSTAVLPSITEPATITSSSWRPDADKIIEHAWAAPYAPEKAWIVYQANKILEERACWDFVKHERPNFVFNTIIPAVTFGEVLHPKLISSTNGAVLGLLDSDPFSVAFITGASPSNFVNVNDVARLHLAALITDRVSSRRLLALGEVFDLNRMVDLLGKLVPGSSLLLKLENVAMPVATVDIAYELELLKDFGRSGFVGFDDAVIECVLTGTKGTA